MKRTGFPPPTAEQIEANRQWQSGNVIARNVGLARRKVVGPTGEEYRDSRGVAFGEVRFLLPASTHDWPTITRVDDPKVSDLMHRLFKTCWHCKRKPVEAHHLCAGSAGKSDELTAIAILCPVCHGQRRETILPLGRILFLKWKFDRQHLDWVRVALLLRKFLPDLIVR